MSGTVTVQQPTGTNLHAVVDSVATPVTVQQPTAANLKATVQNQDGAGNNLTSTGGALDGNIKTIGGTAPSTGTGASGAGIPRVTVANDSAVKVWNGTNTMAIDQNGAAIVNVTEIGKTHMAFALFKRALQIQQRLSWKIGHGYVDACWAVSVPQLIEELFTYRSNFGRGGDTIGGIPSRPTVMACWITQAAAKGYRPCVFLDELDKLQPNDNRMSFIHEIVKTTKECGGQIIACSNLPWGPLAAKLGPEYGEAIVTRIAGRGKAGLIDLF